MHLRTVTQAALALSLVIGGAGVTHAADITIGTNGNVQADMNATGSTTNASAGAAGGATVGSTGASGSGTVSAGLGGTLPSLTSILTDADLNAYTSALLSSEQAGAAAQTSDSVGSSGSNPSGSVSADVSGEASLDAVKTGRLTDVSYADDGMTITYRQPARMLWLIPVTVSGKATIAGDGDVQVSYPWYSVFLTTHRDQIENAIKARVAALRTQESVMGSVTMDATGATALGGSAAGGDVSGTVGVTADAAVSGTLSPRLRAEILEATRDVLHRVDVNGMVDANAAVTGAVDTTL